MRAAPRFLRLAAFGFSASICALAGCFDTRTIPLDDTAGARNSGAAGRRSTSGGGSATAAGFGAEGGDDPMSAAGEAGGELGGAAAAGRAGSAGAAQAGSGNAVGVTWLTLKGSQAPSSEPINASLGINGTLYAYADGCATLSWDEGTRCASGQLCTAGANFENWGIAVGFDFHGTGPNDDPPDTKLLWNPEQVGALGVAWRIRGNAPGRQVWVLNMQPAFHGQCGVMTCEIAGPPDGSAMPALEGQLLFDHMVKDNWGGSGTPYVYDPAAVYALQFKLPAINVGAASFSFCIDALGVVR